VCVKFSTWPEPQNPRFLQDTLRAFDNIGGALSGHDQAGEHRWPPGIASGLERHGVVDRSTRFRDA
jgi:hypothetical protein